MTSNKAKFDAEGSTVFITFHGEREEFCEITRPRQLLSEKAHLADLIASAMNKRYE